MIASGYIRRVLSLGVAMSDVNNTLHGGDAGMTFWVLVKDAPHEANASMVCGHFPGPQSALFLGNAVYQFLTICFKLATSRSQLTSATFASGDRMASQ
jgi:hypothetical protein